MAPQMPAIKWNLEQKRVRNLTNGEILKDVFERLWLLVNPSKEEPWQIKKVTKRRAFNQAVYAVAKKFGHRSAYRDLQFVHPSMGPAFPFHGEWLPIPEITRHQVYFTLMLLGRESKKGATGTSAKDRLSGNTRMANQIQINVQRNSYVAVEMDLTAPAFYNLCQAVSREGSSVPNKVRDIIKARLVEKWGAENASYGMYEQQSGRNPEGFKIVRLEDGVPVVHWGSETFAHV